MKRATVHIVRLSIVVGVFFAIVMVNAHGGSATDPDKAGSEAAKKNALLRTELSWTFGGKPQRGWYLYEQLIKRLINTKSDAATVQFSSAVGRWQAKSGLSRTGILDEE